MTTHVMRTVIFVDLRELHRTYMMITVTVLVIIAVMKGAHRMTMTMPVILLVMAADY